MALTAQQLVDTRRFMGYSVSGDLESHPYREVVSSSVTLLGVQLDYRLQHLSAEEEGVLVNTYLTNLTKLESDIIGVAANLDTDKAAVWTHNKRERQDREALFDSWRRRLCAFLGFKPGPDLGMSNNMMVVRA